MQRVLEPRLAYGLVAALYLLVFPYHPALRSPNELCRLWQTRALVDHQTISLNQTMQEYGGVGDLSIRNGVYYPSKAPLLSFAAVPVYWVLKKIGPVSDTRQVYWSRLFLTIAPTFVLLVFLRRFLCAYLEPATADTVTVTYALGSLAFNYSEAFFSHQLTAVLLFFGFYAAWRTLRGEWKPWGWLVAGAFTGATVATEYTGALGVVGIALYVAWDIAREKKKPVDLVKIGALVLAGAAPFLGPLMWYHTVAFGGPFTSGYKFLNDANYQPWHLGGFLGIRYPDPRAFVLSFFSPLRGLFTLSPFLLLAFGGLKPLWKEHRSLFVLTAVLLLGNAYFTSSFTYDSWGWAVGPRHLTPLIPFLMLPAGLALQRLRAATSLDGQLGYGIAVGLCVSSVLMEGFVTMVNYVPDSTSVTFWSLAWPLYKQGYLPPTVLSYAGIAVESAGHLAVLLLLGAGAVVGVRLGNGRARAVVVGAVVAGVCHFGLLSGAARRDQADAGALWHLRSVWVNPAKGAPVPPPPPVAPYY